MASIEPSAITLIGKDGNTTPGTLHTTHFDQGDRLKRALQRLGLFWLLAGVTVFIPLAHFVLVPGFFIAGPVIAYITYRTDWVRNHAAGVCPVCHQEIQLSMDTGDQLPKWTYCPDCHAPLHMTEVDGASADAAVTPNT